VQVGLIVVHNALISFRDAKRCSAGAAHNVRRSHRRAFAKEGRHACRAADGVKRACAGIACGQIFDKSRITTVRATDQAHLLELRGALCAFRITDQQDQQDQPGYGKGHQSRAYLIVPRSGVVTVNCGDGFDVTGQPKQPRT
jgi:hypothetical protein